MIAGSVHSPVAPDAGGAGSAHQALIALYDELALSLRRGQKAAHAQQRQAVSAHLQHARLIVLELLSSLRVDVWEGGPRLAELYAWLIGELARASRDLDTDRIWACSQVVEPLRDAWRLAAGALPSTEVA